MVATGPGAVQQDRYARFKEVRRMIVNQDEIPDIKKRLTNLNIPIQSFYYSLHHVNSTYNKGLVDDLDKYNKNKDEFLEELKKRKK